jgi:hypothetical protein
MARHEEEGGLGLEVGSLGVGVKQVGVVLGLVFAVTLAVVIGKQMTAEAMAVVIGVVCGVAAGIPTSFLLWVMLTRREQRAQRAEEQARRAPGSYPPVVVIQGGTAQPQMAQPQAGYWPAPNSGPLVSRQFHVVGGNELGWPKGYEQ